MPQRKRTKPAVVLPSGYIPGLTTRFLYRARLKAYHVPEDDFVWAIKIGISKNPLARRGGADLALTIPLGYASVWATELDRQLEKFLKQWIIDTDRKLIPLNSYVEEICLGGITVLREMDKAIIKEFGKSSFEIMPVEHWNELLDALPKSNAERAKRTGHNLTAEQRLAISKRSKEANLTRKDSISKATKAWWTALNESQKQDHSKKIQQGRTEYIDRIKQRNQQIVESLKNNETDDSISAKFKVSKQVVLMVRREAGLDSKSLRVKRNKTILELAESGYKAKDIAKDLGISAGIVYRALAKS